MGLFTKKHNLRGNNFYMVYNWKVDDVSIVEDISMVDICEKNMKLLNNSPVIWLNMIEPHMFQQPINKNKAILWWAMLCFCVKIINSIHPPPKKWCCQTPENRVVRPNISKYDLQLLDPLVRPSGPCTGPGDLPIRSERSPMNGFMF